MYIFYLIYISIHFVYCRQTQTRSAWKKLVRKLLTNFILCKFVYNTNKIGEYLVPTYYLSKSELQAFIER